MGGGWAGWWALGSRARSRMCSAGTPSSAAGGRDGGCRETQDKLGAGPSKRGTDQPRPASPHTSEQDLAPRGHPLLPLHLCPVLGGRGTGRGAAWWFPSAPRPPAPWGRELHRLAPRPPRGGPARPPVPSQLWLGGGPATKPAPCGGRRLRGARQCACGAAPPHTPVLPVAFLSVQRGQKPAAARQAAAAVSTGRTEPLATSWSPAHRGVRVAGGRSGVLPSPPAWGPNVQPGHWTPHPH